MLLIKSQTSLKTLKDDLELIIGFKLNKLLMCLESN